MTSKQSSFTKLMKKLSIKNGQSVGVYKLITKRIEKERQSTYVPKLKEQISMAKLNRQTTQQLYDLIEKDKEIDRTFIENDNGRDVDEEVIIVISKQEDIGVVSVFLTFLIE